MTASHYAPQPCAAQGCAENALTGASTCWHHLEDRADFVQNLKPTELADAWLVDVDLSGREWCGAVLTRARLSGAKLAGANLCGADLRWAFLDGADLRGANLQEAKMELAVLGGADVSGADFTQADLCRANLVGTRGHKTNFSRADLYYARPGNADLRGALFCAARIERTIFRRANLECADFTSARGTANFENARLGGCKR